MSKVSKCFPKRMIPGAKRDLRAEGVGREGCVGVRVCVCVCVCVCVLSRVRICNPMDCSPPGSSVHGILQARTLEWVAISSFRGSSRPRDQTHVSGVSCSGRQILYHWAIFVQVVILNWRLVCWVIASLSVMVSLLIPHCWCWLMVVSKVAVFGPWEDNFITAQMLPGLCVLRVTTASETKAQGPGLWIFRAKSLVPFLDLPSPSIRIFRKCVNSHAKKRLTRFTSVSINIQYFPGSTFQY